MNRKQAIESAFNYCSTLNYDEEVVSINQQEVDALLGGEKIVNINKIKMDKETTLLAVGSLSSINKFPLIKR